MALKQTYQFFYLQWTEGSVNGRYGALAVVEKPNESDRVYLLNLDVEGRNVWVNC